MQVPRIPGTQSVGSSLGESEFGFQGDKIKLFISKLVAQLAKISLTEINFSLTGRAAGFLLD